MKQLIGFQVNIPDVFKEREDLFLEQLAENLRDNHTAKLVRFRCPDGTHTYISYDKIFTDQWDFIQMPEGF